VTVSDKEQTTEPKTSIWKNKQFKYILLLIAAALVVILVTVLVQKPTNRDEYLQSSGYLGVFLMAVIGSASPIWPLPGSWAAFFAAGLGLNPIIVGLVAGFGEPIGEVVFYTVGYGSRLVLEKWKRYAQIMNWMRRHGGLTIFVLSAIPNFFVKLATTSAGALRYPLWKFFIFCWAGKTVKSLAFAFAGYGLFDGIKHLIDRIF
jgi:membrane protein DedA with SNARE-associated domain